MTTPSQPPPQPQQAQQLADYGADALLATAIGTALLSAVSAAAAMPILAAGIRASRLPTQAVLAALDIVMSHPPGQTGFFGPATHATEALNLQRRSAFVVAAARRIAGDLVTARSQGTPMLAALAAGVRRERRFYAQHLIATWQRSQAGAQVDTQAMTHGLLLGWHATRDAKSSAECLAADGKNFYADHMPLIGYPGAVHPHCRCQAGAPFPGGRIVPSYGVPAQGRYRRAA